MVLAVQVLLVHTSKCHRKVQIYNPLLKGATMSGAISDRSLLAFKAAISFHLG